MLVVAVAVVVGQEAAHIEGQMEAEALSPAVIPAFGVYDDGAWLQPGYRPSQIRLPDNPAYC